MSTLDRQFMRDVAEGVKAKLPDGYGFIVFAFPFRGEGNQRMLYASNAERADAINSLKEWLLRCGAAEDWMKHIN